eukprot:m.55362 g.55362  ORF g.55362 m.55362 type:complete len:51 (-) comp11485_c0_seq1:4455-4607(-)
MHRTKDGQKRHKSRKSNTKQVNEKHETEGSSMPTGSRSCVLRGYQSAHVG